ncbi:Cathepsin_B [Hexamita inflata]|uniref:Cathepsin B n=1 Tax=Hexamita inflata TaxID=28002 RepID=A0AA86TPI2_9EUKA|nr:Cathepsin B [Hexamita inflata]CAI9978006.1 Cathepsin B [Hexamita inflata]
MFVIISLGQNYHSQEVLNLLKNIPDMSWTPAIPERFKGMSYDSIINLFSQNINSHNSQKVMFRTTEDLPASFSWLTQKPDCLEVRDQGACGSCWAMSAVGSFSDNRCITGKDSQRIRYSEQYEISCDYVNRGCNGGSLSDDMNFLKRTGLPTDDCVSYKSGSDGLKHNCPNICDDGTEITKSEKLISYVNVCQNEESIMAALTVGTIQTSFAVYTDFNYYCGGIYQHKYGSLVGGHAVIIVGYGEENGIKYWDARNSWGTSWGEKGYFRISRGNNECDFESECYLQTV